MAHGEGMSVQAPLPRQQLADPAAEEPTGLRRLAEKAQVGLLWVSCWSAGGVHR